MLRSVKSFVGGDAAARRRAAGVERVSDDDGARTMRRRRGGDDAAARCGADRGVAGGSLASIPTATGRSERGYGGRAMTVRRRQAWRRRRASAPRRTGAERANRAATWSQRATERLKATRAGGRAASRRRRAATAEATRASGEQGNCRVCLHLGCPRRHTVKRRRRRGEDNGTEKGRWLRTALPQMFPQSSRYPEPRYRNVATETLPPKCCHRNVATEMLPRNVATQMLPPKCCRRNVASCLQRLQPPVSRPSQLASGFRPSLQQSARLQASCFQASSHQASRPSGPASSQLASSFTPSLHQPQPPGPAASSLQARALVRAPSGRMNLSSRAAEVHPAS